MADSKKKPPARSRVQSGPLRQTTLSPSSGAVRRGDGAKPAGKATGSATGLTFSEVQGDLFGCPSTYSLAHCVSEDLAMGKGVAVHFKEQFGRIGELRSQGWFLGKG